MTAVVSDPDPAAVIEACFDDLAANAPADAVLPKLREIEPWVEGDPKLKGRLLRARAIATNRLGFGSEALGDLHEARRLLESQSDAGELAKVFLAIATVFIWRGDGREAALALLRAVAEASVAGDRTSTAIALIEAGRVQMEIGRPGDAQALLARALDLGAETIIRREYQRAWINLLQASVAAGLVENARTLRDSAPAVLNDASSRLRMLCLLESARIDRLSDDLAAARVALAEAEALFPDPESFEAVEIAYARAELAFAEGDAAGAADLLANVVARYASDDLAAREVPTRLLQAQVLVALQRWDDADRTLGAALRRAIARGLTGFADQVRSFMAARGSDERAGLSGDVPAEAASPDTAARFVRQRPLGAGGFAKVLRAYDLELGVDVAIKRSSLKDVYDPALRGRLLEAARTEVEAASRLNHPGIARVYGLLADANGDSLLIEEFVEGPTLRDAMKSAVEPARAHDLLARMAFSLAAVHATGVVHRDLKPDNIILRGGSAPVLVDFGIALLSKSGNMATGGTPDYMPPEQARGAKVDHRSDLYAFGVMAFELLLGKRPDPLPTFPPAFVQSFFRKRKVAALLLDAGVDAEAARLVSQLMAPHPRFRPQSAALVGTVFSEAAGRAAGRAP